MQFESEMKILSTELFHQTNYEKGWIHFLSLLTLNFKQTSKHRK